MPSPFPGMNPYLEQADVWQDFHQSFIPLLRQLLSEQVRPKYVVKIEEQIFIHGLPEDQRQLIGRSDMTVSRSEADSTGTAVVLNVGLWPLGLRNKLPTIPIPLLAQERAVLDLQSALHQVYDAAGYEDYIYANEPNPPLQGADAEWAQRLSAAKGG